MHTINAHFECLDEMPVTELFGAIGVYVLWSRRANVRPSYLGEGNLIERFAKEHIDRFGEAMTGYAAIMRDGTAKQQKTDAEMLEATLLYVGAEIDQAPPNNRAKGKLTGFVQRYDERHNVVKIHVSGYHPLRWDKRLQKKALIRADLSKVDRDVFVAVEHPWRRVG